MDAEALHRKPDKSIGQVQADSRIHGKPAQLSLFGAKRQAHKSRCGGKDFAAPPHDKRGISRKSTEEPARLRRRSADGAASGEGPLKQGPRRPHSVGLQPPVRAQTARRAAEKIPPPRILPPARFTARSPAPQKRFCTTPYIWNRRSRPPVEMKLIQPETTGKFLGCHCSL